MAVSLKNQPKNHLLYIDSIRALAALYVVMHHAVLQYYDTTRGTIKNLEGFNLSTFEKLIVMLFYHGHYSVDLFIVVSGFSLMLSVTKNGSLKGGNKLFFKRRVIRILPPYYFAIALSVFLIWIAIGHKTGTVWDLSIPITYIDIIKHALLIHDFSGIGCYTINYPLWSIAVEFRIYLFFPFLVWLWKKWGFVSVISSAALITIVGSLILLYFKLSNPTLATDVAGVSPYILLFTFGMLAADLSFSKSAKSEAIRKKYLKLSPITVLAAIIVFFIVCPAVRHLFPTDNYYIKKLGFSDKVFDIILGVFFAFLLFICAIPSRPKGMFWLTKILSWQPLVFIGTFSYSLYLIHSPLLMVIYQYVLLPLNLSRFTACMTLLIGGTSLITAIAWVFFYFFERPFLTLGKKPNVVAQTIAEPAP